MQKNIPLKMNQVEKLPYGFTSTSIHPNRKERRKIKQKVKRGKEFKQHIPCWLDKKGKLLKESDRHKAEKFEFRTVWHLRSDFGFC